MKKQTVLRILLTVFGITSSSIYNPGIAYSDSTVSKKIKPIGLVFDLGGVLVETNYLRASWYLGLPSLATYAVYYMLSSHKNPLQFQGFSIRHRFYQLLNRINQTEGNIWGCHDEEGFPLPQLLSDLLLSKVSNKHLLTTILNHIDHHPEWFNSRTEKILLSRMANMIFTPHHLIDTRLLNSEGIQFVQQCKLLGYKLYILSNWDTESFAYFSQQHPEFFSLFDEIIISGNCKMVKPNPAIYAPFVNDSTMDWIIIDDQLENIRAAHALGLKAIHTKKKKALFNPTTNFTHLQKAIFNVSRSH